MRALFDLRVIVGVCGVVLSVVMHELFHIIVHWGEVTDVNLFPDSHAIVEVLFVPSAEYDLVVEEALAYMITMATIVLTAMLIHDIDDLHDNRSVEQIIMAKDYSSHNTNLEQREAIEQLSAILGVAPASSR